MENLDSTVIVTALPQMARSFGTDPVGLNIGVTAYMLAVAVFIPVSGWMVDRFGARGVFAAAIFSFLASWDEVVVSIFMASPTLQTLPVRIWSTLRQDLTPVIAAASSLLVGLTVILMLLGLVLKRGKS